jgi:hypothetical protein
MAYQTLDDLDSIISTLNTLSNQAQRKEETRYRRDASIYDDFNSDVEKTYSNSELNIIEERVNNYITQYGSNMNDLSIENFALLKDKIKFQRQDNERYENNLGKAMNVVGIYGKNMDEIINIQNMPNEEFEYNGVMANKQTHIQTIKNNMLTNITDYAKYSEDLRNNFSKRLDDPSQIEELYKIQSYDDMFRFGLNTALKDNYIDDFEFNAYNESINTKSYEPIKNYLNKKQQNDSLAIGNIAKQAENMYEQINANDARMEDYYQFLEYAENAINPDLSQDERLEATNNRDNMSKQILMPSGDKDSPYVFGDLLKKDNSIDLFGEINAMVMDSQAEAELYYEKLNRLDNQYTSASGGFGLQSLGFSFNNSKRNPDYEPRNPQQEAKNKAKNLGQTTYIFKNQKYNVSDDSPVVVSPQEETTQLVNKELLKENITISNIEQDVSEIKDEYKKGNKYSAGETKLRNEYEALNKEINNIETSTIMGNPEGSGIGSKIFKPSANKFYDFNNYASKDGGAGIANYTNIEGLVEEIVGSSDRVKNGRLNYQDLAKLELKYNEDILKKADLVKDYKQKRDAGLDKNLPEMKNLQNEINKIYMRWFAKSESCTRRAWRL